MDSQTLPPQVGEIIENGQQAVAGSVKTVISDVSSTISDQVGIKNETNASQNIQNHTAPATEPLNQASNEDLELTKEMVSDYYSPSQVQFNAEQAELEEQQRQAELIKVRQELALQLHNDVYYNEIQNAGAKKPQGQASEQEEMEQARQQDQMQDLEAKDKKDQDISRFMAERHIEIAGNVVG